MIKQKISFFFNAKTQFENFGDAIISRELLLLANNKGEVHILTENVPKDFLILICASNYKQYKTKISFFSMLFFLAIRSFFVNSQVFYLLNPGGFSGGVNFKDSFRQSILILIYFIFYIFKIKLIRIGASISNFSKSRGVFESLKANFIYYNTYRDKISLNLAKEANIKVDNIVPDLAFLLKVENKIYTKFYNYIVLSFRNRGDEKIDRSIDSLLDKQIFLDKYDKLNEFLFCSQVGFDFEFNATLCKKFNDNGLVAKEYNPLNKMEYINIYSNSKFILSNRLHVLIFSLISGTPAVGLVDMSHDQKIIGIYEDLGLNDLLCYVSDVEKYDWDIPLTYDRNQILKKVENKRYDIVDKFNKLFAINQ